MVLMKPVILLEVSTVWLPGLWLLSVPTPQSGTRHSQGLQLLLSLPGAPASLFSLEQRADHGQRIDSIYF